MRSAAQPHSPPAPPPPAPPPPSPSPMPAPPPPAPPLPLHRVYVCVWCRFFANGSAGMEYNMGYGVQYNPGYAPPPLPPPVPLLGLLPFFSRAHGKLAVELLLNTTSTRSFSHTLTTSPHVLT